jgi:hypothetical protein
MMRDGANSQTHLLDFRLPLRNKTNRTDNQGSASVPIISVLISRLSFNHPSQCLDRLAKPHLEISAESDLVRRIQE